MLILFDHGTPRGLARALPGHTVITARARGWDRLNNGAFVDGGGGSRGRSLAHYGPQDSLSAEPHRPEDCHRCFGGYYEVVTRTIASGAHRRPGERVHTGQLYRGGHPVRVRNANSRHPEYPEGYQELGEGGRPRSATAAGGARLGARRQTCAIQPGA